MIAELSCGIGSATVYPQLLQNSIEWMIFMNGKKVFALTIVFSHRTHLCLSYLDIVVLKSSATAALLYIPNYFEYDSHLAF